MINIFEITKEAGSLACERISHKDVLNYC